MLFTGLLGAAALSAAAVDARRRRVGVQHVDARLGTGPAAHPVEILDEAIDDADTHDAADGGDPASGGDLEQATTRKMQSSVYSTAHDGV